MNRPDGTDPKTTPTPPPDKASEPPAQAGAPRGDGELQAPPAAPKRARNGKTRHASRR